MALEPVDSQHFYLDGKLIDLVWIKYQAKKQVNAANYHGVMRTLNWLNKLADRLSRGELLPDDEALAREKLRSLGLSWYLEQ